MTRNVASLLVPIVCERCGAVKRNADGQTLYVALSWRRGKTMLCPACHTGLEQMRLLEDLVSWDDMEDVPF